MLNELHQVVEALEKSGTDFGSPHEALAFMGKGDALHLLLDHAGNPQSLRVIPGESASKLMRVAHTAAGSAFPGFNLPIPLMALPREMSDACVAVLTMLCATLKSKTSSGAEIIALAAQLRSFAVSRSYEDAQNRQFSRSLVELTKWLADDLEAAPVEFACFKELIRRCHERKPTLGEFCSSVEAALWGVAEPSRDEAILLCQVAFGLLLFPKLKATIGSSAWRAEKQKADGKDTEKSVPVFLDVVDYTGGVAITKPAFWTLLNGYLNQSKPSAYKAEARSSGKQDAGATKASKKKATTVEFTDAFTGEGCLLLDSFPKPKVAKLGEVRLFSNNTKEAKCFIRYGLEGSETFAMSADLAKQMAGALEHLGAEGRLGKTCRAIPSAREGKQDLLIAYLNGEPETDTAFAELMGGSIEDMADASSGFEPQAAAVLGLLQGKLVANPELRMCLLSIAVVDKANRQVSLCRDFLVAELVQAVKRWNAGQRAVAHSVSLIAYDRDKKAVVHWHPPSVFPLDLASVANKIWATESKAGLASSYNRVLTSAEAFDVFLQDSERASRTCALALGTLTRRLRGLVAKGGEYKTKGDFKLLGETPRRELLKGISLLSILIHLQPTNQNMKEPTYYLGRLLACADALHMEYCKRVRKDETPSQLIGNALFNTALEQPVFALARLAERLTPYQAWAKTYKHVPKDADDKGGLEKWLLGRIAECCAQFIETDGENIKRIRAEELPTKMSDLDKAKLMLGYMADLRDAK